MNEQQHTSAPVDPAMPDFKAAFEALQDDLLVLERRLYTADFLFDGVAEVDTDHFGMRKIPAAQVEAIVSTMQDTCDALHEVMTAWRATHNSNCEAEAKAYAAGRTA